MKTRYEFIGIVVIVAIIFTITWSSCRCLTKCSHKKQAEGLENEKDIKKKDEGEKEETLFKLSEGMNGVIPKISRHPKKKKEPFDNFYSIPEGYDNSNSSICSNCKQSKHKSSWKCSTCNPNGNTTPVASTENFDNMSVNFNNIQFSTPNSSEVILDFFKNILFSTDCCPSSYSTDKGCACISPSQYDILKTRANNNIPYSDF